MRSAFAACVAIAAYTPAIAQEVPYLDDRSSASSLVRSLYNAIERKEYARAWSYFAEPPAANVDAYAQGYADTASVQLRVGTPREEGAAGSVYFELPIAISAEQTSGESKTFAGCYTIRMSDSTIGETFQPMIIERGGLKPTDEELDDAIPRKCGNGPELPAHDASLEKAQALYTRLDRCNIGQFASPEELAPEAHELRFRYAFDTNDQPERVFKLYRFLCSRGAYNESHAYFIADDTGEVAPLHFAQPTVDVRYVEGGEEKVESINVIGYSTYPYLVNSEYDPETLTISSHSRWRGLGDASSTGKWIFRRGQFDLVHYEVDASYDGEINGEVVVNYDEAP